MQVTDTNGLHTAAPFALTVNVVPLSRISLTGNLAFGPVTVGTNVQQTLTIANGGDAALHVSSISYPSGFSGAFSGTIAAGSATNVTVTFTPTAMISYSGLVTVNSDANAGTNTITATGIGIAAPLRLINLTGNLAFDNVTIGTTAQRTLTIANTGNALLNVTGIDYPTGFSGPFAGSLAPGVTTNVLVSFTPATIAGYGGTVIVSSDANGGSNTINAAGAGVSPLVVITTAPAVSNALLQFNQRFVVGAGETNLFTVGATDPGGNPLIYQWTFGDGVTDAWSTASAATHLYATNDCGPQVASVTISNGYSAISTNVGVTVACALTITKLQATVNFAKTNADTCTLAARVALGAKYNLTNKVVVLDIAGARVAFTLDAKGKGRGTGANGSCTLTYNKPTGTYLLAASLAKGSWHTPWAAQGMINATVKKSPPTVVTLLVTVIVDAEAFAADRSLLYTATVKKTGTAK